MSCLDETERHSEGELQRLRNAWRECAGVDESRHAAEEVRDALLGRPYQQVYSGRASVIVEDGGPDVRVRGDVDADVIEVGRPVPVLVRGDFEARRLTPDVGVHPNVVVGGAVPVTVFSAGAISSMERAARVSSLVASPSETEMYIPGTRSTPGTASNEPSASTVADAEYSVAPPGVVPDDDRHRGVRREAGAADGVIAEVAFEPSVVRLRGRGRHEDE